MRRLQGDFGSGRHDLEQSGSGAGRMAAVLLPILKRSDTDAHQPCKVALGKAGARPDRLHVWGWHHEAAGSFHLALDDGPRLFQALAQFVEKGLFKKALSMQG